MSHVYIDNLDAWISERVEDEFQTYGVIRHIWVGRKPSGYAFIDFDDHRDAKVVIHDLDGKHNMSVELFHYYRGGGDRSGSDHDSEELGTGSGRRCNRTHHSYRK